MTIYENGGYWVAPGAGVFLHRRDAQQAAQATEAQAREQGAQAEIRQDIEAFNRYLGGRW